jgi:hypothetical protein
MWLLSEGKELNGADQAKRGGDRFFLGHSRRQLLREYEHKCLHIITIIIVVIIIIIIVCMHVCMRFSWDTLGGSFYVSIKQCIYEGHTF